MADRKANIRDEAPRKGQNGSGGAGQSSVRADETRSDDLRGSPMMAHLLDALEQGGWACSTPTRRR